MRVAIIGAGIVGVTTAYELALDGHEVTVYEQDGGVATGASFANAGVIAPGYVTPWSSPGMLGKVLRNLLSSHTPVRLSGIGVLASAPWLWRWWRSCRPAVYTANRTRMHRLANFSRDRLNALTHQLHLEYEQTRGYMVLLRTERDLALARASIKLLSDLGVPFELLDGERARLAEPGLSPSTPLRAAVRLPQDGVGNCRQFAHQLKGEAQKLGAQFRFQARVLSIEPGAPASVKTATGSQVFDGVVICAGATAASLLGPIGVSVPIQAVHGYSITAPIRHVDGQPEAGPRGALMDEAYKVAISRLGQRVRVAGSAEIGGRLDQMSAPALATLYKVMEDWFPGAMQQSKVQQWKGARPMMPDGPPLLGASGRPGVWLNVGHGSSGWALSAGSARVVADLIGGRSPGLDLEGLGIERLA